MDIKYDYSGVPTLAEFAMSDAMIRAINGPFASGKSSACVIEIVRRATQMPPGPDGIRRSKWGIVRNTYDQLNKTTLQTVFQWLPEMYFGRYTKNDHIYRITALPGVDLELQFIALDRPEDIAKLLSLELTAGWINESREVPWSIVEAMQGRVGRFPPRRDVPVYWDGIIMDTNPPDSDSSYYRFFEERGWVKDFERLRNDGILPSSMVPEQYAAIFKQPSGLSPKAENLTNLKPGYYQQLTIGKTEEWIKVYVHGDYGFVMEGRLVYPEYSDRLHCHEVDPLPGRPIIRAFDFGLTPACTFNQLLPDGRWLVFDEMTSDNMSIDQFSDEVLEHCNRSFRGNVQFEDWGDPAGDQRAQTDKRTCFEIMQTKGFDISGSIQEPTLRQEAVRKALRTLVNGEPQFILHPRCRVLRKGFMGGYHRRRMQVPGPERYASAPEKNFASHCFPAGVMVSTPQGDRPIESLRVGDVVETPSGPRAVQATMNSMTDQLVEVQTRGGRQFKCTPDHPVWNGGGFVRADALQYGDVLGVAECRGPNIPSRHSMGSDTIGSQKVISRHLAASTSTAQCGPITTGLFRMASSSIMRTTTARIMRSRISVQWPRLITRAIMASTERSTIRKVLVSTWRTFAQRRANGIDQRKAVHGIESMRSRSLPTFLTKITSAFNAAPTMSLSGAAGSAVIALPLANRLLAERAALTTKPELVSSATSYLRPIATPKPRHADSVAAVSFGAPTSICVYDLTIEDAHCFYANGILVGNCHDALQYAMVKYFGSGLTDGAPADDDWPMSGHGGGYGGGEPLPSSSSTGY